MTGPWVCHVFTNRHNRPGVQDKIDRIASKKKIDRKLTVTITKDQTHIAEVRM